MEEEIKILEEYIENLFKYGDRELLEKENIVKCIEYREIQAIENLLKENKTSKETINILTNKLEQVVDENNKQKNIIKEFNKLFKSESFIPISVIQNKKKEEREKCVARFRYGNDEAPLESYKYKYTDIDMNEYAGSEIMRVLQELLEERNK